jgi:hypothetical protein
MAAVISVCGVLGLLADRLVVPAAVRSSAQA